MAAASVAILAPSAGGAAAQTPDAMVAASTQTVTVEGEGAFPIAFSDTTPAVEMTFEISGVVGELTDIAVDLDIAHTWVGDIQASLFSPGDVVSHDLMNRPGIDRIGPTFSSNLDGLYTFDDGASQSLLATAASLSTIPPGEYRTSTRALGGGEDTLMTPAFAGLTDLNGVWTLRVQDLALGDQGTVRSASLSITTDLPVDIEGPFAPVGEGDNTVKAGSMVPLKFRVFDGTIEVTDPAVIASVVPLEVACESGVSPPEPVEIMNKGNTGLRYADDEFILNWKTPMTPGCYQVTVTTVDDTSITAHFTLR